MIGIKTKDESAGKKSNENVIQFSWDPQGLYYTGTRQQERKSEEVDVWGAVGWSFNAFVQK
jgi:hypothetical protein